MEEKNRILGENSTSQSHQSISNERERVIIPEAPVTQVKRPLAFSLRTSEPSASSTRSTNAKENFTTRLLDGVVSVSLFALFFGLPIFFTGMTLQGLAFEKEIYFYFWLLLAVVSWVSRGVISGEMKIRKTPLDIPIVIFVVTYIVSAFTSVDRWHSFWGAFGDPSRGVLNVIALVAVYYLILSHCTTKRIHLMLSGLLASSFVVMLWSLLIISGIHFLPSSIEQRAPLSLLGSVTALMIFLAACLPIFIATISLVQSFQNRGKSFKSILTGILLTGVVLDLVLLFLLHPYVSWFAAIAGFSFFLLYILAQVIKIEERWTWLPMFVLVVLLAFYMIGPVNLLKTTLPVEATPNMKLSWGIAKDSFKDKPFLGSGPATYGYNFSLYRPQEYNQQPLSALRFTLGTGLYYEAVSTIGVIGLIAFTILLLSFVSVGLFLLSQRKEVNKFLSLGLWSTTTVILIAALSTQFSGAILIFGVLIATLSLAVLMKESQSEESWINLSLQSSPKFALALAFVFLVVSAGVAFTFAFIGKAFWADVLAAKSMESSVGNIDGASKMAQATKYMPHESRYASYLGQIYLTMATHELGKPEKERDADALKKYIESANGLAKLAHDMSPNDIIIQETLAQTYENTLSVAGLRPELLDAVQSAYEQASALEPHNPVYYVKLGQIKKTLANSAKPDEQKTLFADAIVLFQKAIDKKLDFALGYFNLGLAQESSGDIDAAIVSFAKGLSIDKTSKDADELKYNLARLLRIRGKEDNLKFSETFLKEIIANNDKSLNAHLTLGLVYEQTKRKDDAIKSYEKVLALMTGDNTDAAKKQVQTFIDNVKAGKSNNITPTEPSSQVSSNALPEIPPVPNAPAVPNLPITPETQTPVTNTSPIIPLQDQTGAESAKP
jgi:tetratricopeptide (TPR) repeat protein